jgi:DNA-binding transcriptional LysR family regulator
MELDHPEAIKQAVMARLGIALVFIHAVRGELASRRLAALRGRGCRWRGAWRLLDLLQRYKAQTTP